MNWTWTGGSKRDSYISAIGYIVKPFWKGKEWKTKRVGIWRSQYSFRHVALGLCLEISSRTEILTIDRNLRIEGQKKKKKELKADNWSLGMDKIF